jgi:hypothetical protein
MMRSSGNCPGLKRIPNDEIRVGPQSDAPFLRVDVKDFGSVCASNGHKSTRVDDPRLYSFLPYDRHPVFYPVYPIGNFGKVVFANFLLRLVKSAIVATGDLQHIPTLQKKVVIFDPLLVHSCFATIQLIIYHVIYPVK